MSELRYAGISLSTVNKWVAKRKIPVVKLGRGKSPSQGKEKRSILE